MRYIISESRLDKVVYVYLDTIFEPHELFNDGHRTVWVVNGKVVGFYNRVDFFICIKLFEKFMLVFSFSIEEAREKIKKYLHKKTNIPFINVFFKSMHKIQRAFDDSQRT